MRKKKLLVISYHGLSASRAPAVESHGAAHVAPLREVGLAEHDGAGVPEPGHHAGVAPGDGPEQRERPGRRVQPVARRDEVLDQHGDAVEEPAPAARRRPLGVGTGRVAERVGVHLDDGVELRVQPRDLVQVVADQRRRVQAAVLEALLDALESGLFELERGAAGGDGESNGRGQEQQSLPSHAACQTVC